VGLSCQECSCTWLKLRDFAGKSLSSSQSSLLGTQNHTPQHKEKANTLVEHCNSLLRKGARECNQHYINVIVVIWKMEGNSKRSEMKI